MFGYIGINKPELKIKEYDEYRSTYCGLCQSLGKNHGVFGQITLTYDMTFLGILLTGLYEEPVLRTTGRCPMNPFRKVSRCSNSYIDYAADMNVLLACYNLQDDWLDDRDPKSLLLYRLLKGRCRQLEQRYPRQKKAVADYLKALHRCEKERSSDLDLAAGLTGQMLGEIFALSASLSSDHSTESFLTADLRTMGFYMGKFIYLMDAYEDYEEDRASGSYNPWVLHSPDQLAEEEVRQILTMMMGEAARAFERLPILKNADLIRNILYSGVWGRYESIRRRRSGESVPREKRCHREDAVV